MIHSLKVGDGFIGPSGRKIEVKEIRVDKWSTMVVSQDSLFNETVRPVSQFLSIINSAGYERVKGS